MREESRDVVLAVGQTFLALAEAHGVTIVDVIHAANERLSAGRTSMAERLLIGTTKQMVIHARAEPGAPECVTKKPALWCPCGLYEIAWEPAPACPLRLTTEAWIRGEDLVERDDG
jgi:hypothetical protein